MVSGVWSKMLSSIVIIEMALLLGTNKYN
jgi:hypothetical protein